MNNSINRLVYWTPRIMGIPFAAFISLFALDVFEDGFQGFQTILALLIHLLPTTGLVVLALIISWRWEWVGALLFSGLGVF